MKFIHSFIKIKNNIKYKKYTLFIFTFLLLLSLFILIKYFLKNNSKETYLNYFLPYYSTNSTAIYDFYDKDDDNNNQTKKSFIYKPLKIGFDEDSEFIKQLGSMFVAKSFINNVSYIKDSDEMNLIKDCNSKNIDLVNCANPLVSNSYVSKDYKNLRFICNTNKMYLYILSTRASRLEALSDISKAITSNEKFVISIDYKDSVSHLFTTDLMSSLGYKESRDYNILYSNDGSSEVALKNLVSNKSKLTILSLPFQPDLLKKECCALGVELFFLPFDLYNDNKTNVFFTKNFYYIRDIYDLNDVCRGYLPKKYGGKTYSRFSAQIPIVSYYNTLVCNSDLDDNTTKEILRTFYENISLFNQLPVFHKQPIYKTQLNGGPQNALPINNGAKEFFIERGYITLEDNESCKYLVGIEECNKKSLEKNGFIEGDTQLDAIFRFH